MRVLVCVCVYVHMCVHVCIWVCGCGCTSVCGYGVCQKPAVVGAPLSWMWHVTSGQRNFGSSLVCCGVVPEIAVM